MRNVVEHNQMTINFRIINRLVLKATRKKYSNHTATVTPDYAKNRCCEVLVSLLAPKNIIF